MTMTKRQKNLRHWLQFWQLRTWVHDNFCYQTIKSDTGQNSQFLMFEKTMTFRKHPQRFTLETCDLCNIWSGWWGDMTLPKWTMTMTLAMTFREHPQRAIPETSDKKTWPQCRAALTSQYSTHILYMNDQSHGIGVGVTHSLTTPYRGGRGQLKRKEGKQGAGRAWQAAKEWADWER